MPDLGSNNVGSLVEIRDSIYIEVKKHLDRLTDKERVLIQDFTTGHTLKVKDLETESVR